jgi:hypothetical protein
MNIYQKITQDVWPDGWDGKCHICGKPFHYTKNECAYFLGHGWPRCDHSALKAWKVGTDEGYYLVHATTRGKAKYIGMNKTDLGLGVDEFTMVHALRAKPLDGLPFTLENAQKVLYIPDPVDEDGFRYSGDYSTTEDWVNQCPCPICRRSRQRD